jgi:hypothetical protein
LSYQPVRDGIFKRLSPGSLTSEVLKENHAHGRFFGIASTSPFSRNRQASASYTRRRRREIRKVSLRHGLLTRVWAGGGKGGLDPSIERQKMDGVLVIPDIYRDPLGDDKLGGGEELEHAQ